MGKLMRLERINACLEAKYTFKRFEEANIHHKQAPILHALYTLGEATQAEIARFLYVSRASIGISLKRLEKDGYVVRKKNNEDSRCSTVSLSESGKKVAVSSFKMLEEVMEQKYKGFTSDEINCIFGFLERMQINLTELNKHCEENEIMEEEFNAGKYSTKE